MGNKNGLVERRENRRFRVSKDTFVALRPHYVKVGQVVDLNMRGLSFRYTADEQPSDGSFELDLFLAGRAFYLYQVPFETVSDSKMADEAPLNSIPMRRSGVQFGQLTSNQTSLLTYFIENHTTGEA